MNDLVNIEHDKKNKVRAMFNGIARSYDFLNHFLSFGVDIWWRKKLIQEAAVSNPHEILDMATGTCDVAIMAAEKLKPQRIVAADIAEEMLQIGKIKIEKKQLQKIISIDVQDAENLTYGDHSFDLVMVSFGVRNFEDLNKGLSEMFRVLKPDGRLLVLEFSTPSNRLVRVFYNFYSQTLMPFFGSLFSRSRSAYRYLPASIRKFPSGQYFVDHLVQVGFENPKIQRLTFGVATLYSVSRKK